MRVLITGGSGLLALNWALAWRGHCEVTLALHKTNAHLRGVDSVWIDFDSFNQLQQQVRELSPQIIIHTAGLTDVDACESDPDLASKINVDLAVNIARIAKNIGAKLIHVSTDHLYDGCQDIYSEDTVLTPLNVYGKTKGKADKEIQGINPNALIVRTNFFGWGASNKNSISDWFLSKLRSGQELRLFKDVYFTPILISEVAKACNELLSKDAIGIYNVVSSQKVSKYQFGKILANEFTIKSVNITPINLVDASLKAPRPLNMALDNSKLKKTIGRDIISIELQCAQLKNQEEQGLKDEIRLAILKNQN